MRGDEVRGWSGDELSCRGSVSSGGRFIWCRGRFVDRGKGGTDALGLRRSSRGVRVLDDGRTCALCRALGRIIGISDVTFTLLLGIRGGVAVDFFGIQDRDDLGGGCCVADAVRVFKVC